jgi:hypothetical protein
MENSKALNATKRVAVSVLATAHYMATQFADSCITAEHKIVGGDLKEVSDARQLATFQRQSDFAQKIKAIKDRSKNNLTPKTV